MDPRQAFYEFMMGLVNLLGPLWPLVGPFVIMSVILGLVRWGWFTARGERDLSAMQQEAEDLTYGLGSGSPRQRYEANRQYRYLRSRGGFSASEIRSHRGAAPGSSFRIRR